MPFKINNIKDKKDLFTVSPGIFKINASAGTGKTYTLIQRYNELLRRNVKTSDVLMVTFTNNSAEEMKNRLINNFNTQEQKNISLPDIINSPVMTFHSFCSKLLKKEGLSAPKLIGIEESIAVKFNILEDSNVESRIFNEFYSRFKRVNSVKYTEQFEITDKYKQDLLKIIKRLSSVGIYPNKESFSVADKKKLHGNYEAYSDLFDEFNQPVGSLKGGEKQNVLFKCFNGKIKDAVTIDFQESILKDPNYSVRINPACKDEVFNDPSQDKWIEFIGKLYWEYIAYLVKRNYLNYEFMVMFAYLILLNNPNARERNKFKFIMVDEFQDTDEIQFKMLLILSGKNEDGKIFSNICVVGDWKQGIYSFRNAAIDNIINFENKLEEFISELNLISPGSVDGLSGDIYLLDLDESRRSSRKILDAGARTLSIKATKEEEVIVQESIFIKDINKFGENSEVCHLSAENKSEEKEIILKKILDIISNKKYIIHEFDAEGNITVNRKAELKDVTVLCRDRKFGLELYRLAVNKFNIPAKLNGGVELFASYPAIILLAWLRILNNIKDIRGWTAILDNEGFKLFDIQLIFPKDQPFEISNLPAKLVDILQDLKKKNDPVNISQAIFKLYGFNDSFANKIINIINSWMVLNKFSLSSLVRMIDENIKNTFDVEIISSENSFTIQTIHNSKGLEYPIVFIANINQRSFPSTKGDKDCFYFTSMTGLRVKKLYAAKNNKYCEFINWRSHLLSSLIEKKYDEERRLFYVAVTRAKQFLYLTSSDPSYFYKEWEEKEEFCYSHFEHIELNFKSQLESFEDHISSEEIMFSE